VFDRALQVIGQLPALLGPDPARDQGERQRMVPDQVGDPGRAPRLGVDPVRAGDVPQQRQRLRRREHVHRDPPRSRQ